MNWKPISAFFDRVGDNPTASQQLFRWLSVNDFSLASDGRIICYKGVKHDFKSGTGGRGAWTDEDSHEFWHPTIYPDGYKRNKRLEYKPGHTVYMLREDCDPNSAESCSAGVHFGTRAYASDYARGGHMMLCLVDPADVVSIPDDDHYKARTCKLTVVAELPETKERSEVSEPVVDIQRKEGAGPVLYDATGGPNHGRQIGVDLDAGFDDDKEEE